MPSKWGLLGAQHERAWRSCSLAGCSGWLSIRYTYVAQQDELWGRELRPFQGQQQLLPPAKFNLLFPSAPSLWDCTRALEGDIYSRPTPGRDRPPLLQADKYGVPRICFVNKMDRMGANFHRTVEMIVTNLAATPLVLQVRPCLCGPQTVCKHGDAASIFSSVFDFRCLLAMFSGGLCPHPPGSAGTIAFASVPNVCPLFKGMGGLSSA